jgi:DNA-directed RNA polymerase alpha subunit
MDFGESDFSPIEEQSPMQILNSLQDKENVEMQTEIQQPLNLTRLETLAKWCGDEKATDSKATLLEFVKDYRINMVSFDRKSRKEIITALTESIKEERRLSDKLMTLPYKET